MKNLEITLLIVFAIATIPIISVSATHFTVVTNGQEIIVNDTHALVGTNVNAGGTLVIGSNGTVTLTGSLLNSGNVTVDGLFTVIGAITNANDIFLRCGILDKSQATYSGNDPLFATCTDPNFDPEIKITDLTISAGETFFLQINQFMNITSSLTIDGVDALLESRGNVTNYGQIDIINTGKIKNFATITNVCENIDGRGLNSTGGAIVGTGSIVDTVCIAPVVTLTGVTPDISLGGIYTELGATCFDAEDGQIDGSVVISGDVVDTNTDGSYFVDYDCEDSEVNPVPATQVTREVIVLPPENHNVNVGITVGQPIVHAFDEVIIPETHTGDSLWTTIPNISLTSGNFTAGKQYLLLVRADVSGSEASSGSNGFNGANYGIRTVHGSTEFDGSEYSFAYQVLRKNAYTYFTVWTAVASEDIKMEFIVHNKDTKEVKAENISITAIELENFIEDEDWFFDERIVNETLECVIFHATNCNPVGDWTQTNPSITFTANGSDHWLVMGNSQLNPNGRGDLVQTRLNLDDTLLTPLHAVRHDDKTSPDEDLTRHVPFLTRVYTPSASSHTVEIESSQNTLGINSNGFGERDYGSIFAINLDKFGYHADNYNPSTTVTPINFRVESNTMTVDFDTTEDTYIMGFQINNNNGGNSDPRNRMQINNQDIWTPFVNINHGGQATQGSQTLTTFFTMEDLSGAVDVDVDSLNSFVRTVVDNQLVAIAMESADNNDDLMGFSDSITTTVEDTDYFINVGFSNGKPINHAFDQSFVSKNGGVGVQPYRTIPDISLTSGNFTAGNKYLVIFKSEMSQHSGFSDFPNLFTRSLHGDTEFTGSEMSLEITQGGTSAGHTYNYFTVWTAVEGEDLTMQFKSDSTRAVSVRHTSISAIELEEFIEGEDYFFDTRVTSDSLSTAWTTTNPSITLTTNGSDDWWVFGNSGFDDIGDFIGVQARINLDDTLLTPHHIQDGEDQITDKQLFYLTRVYTPSASSHTFELESRVDEGTVGTREYSSIFAINLNKFAVHETFYLSDIQSIGTTGSAFDTEAGTLTIDPTQAIDVFAQSFVQSDTISGTCCSYMRLQVGDVSPTGSTDNATKDRHWGGSDIISWVASIIINLDSPTKIDLDVGAFGQLGCCGATSNVWDISLVAFTMQTADGTADPIGFIDSMTATRSFGGGASAQGLIGGIPSQPVFTTLTGLSLISTSSLSFSNADVGVVLGDSSQGSLGIAWNGNNDLIITSITVPEEYDWFEFFAETENNSAFTQITLEAEPDDLRQFDSVEYIVSPPKGIDEIQYIVPITMQGEDSIGNGFKIEVNVVVDTSNIFADPFWIWSFIIALGALVIASLWVYKRRHYKARRRTKKGKKGSFAGQLDKLQMPFN